MNKPDGSGAKPEQELQHMAEDVFSSEKREDIWAIIIAVAVLIFSLLFPEQLHYFFTKSLYLF